MISTYGLALFVLAVVVQVTALVYDAGRAVRSEKTITEWATEKPVREWLLIGGTLLGVVGLTIHFLTFGG